MKIDFPRKELYIPVFERPNMFQELSTLTPDKPTGRVLVFRLIGPDRKNKLKHREWYHYEFMKME